MSQTNIFKVLSDKRRRDILVMLKDGRKSAGEIADLVMEYKSKNFVYYEINTTVFAELILWVEQFGGAGK